MQLTTEQKPYSWLDQPFLAKISINWETVIFSIILILAVVSRFYDVGARVMSHDENSHVYYSWRFYRGQGFAHDPLMHGPFQFHVVALSYFLFGDSDFTAHIPAALFGIATVAFAWAYRRYLGRAGALAAAILLLISPYMLFYARYVRNEIFAALYGMISLWAILRYLETGKARYLYWLTIVTALHYTTKETSFIYSAQALVFLALYLVYRLSQQVWMDAQKRNLFLTALLIAAVLGSAGGLGILQARQVTAGAPATAPDPAENLYPLPSSSPPLWSLILIGLCGEIGRASCRERV